MSKYLLHKLDPKQSKAAIFADRNFRVQIHSPSQRTDLQLRLRMHNVYRSPPEKARVAGKRFGGSFSLRRKPIAMHGWQIRCLVDLS